MLKERERILKMKLLEKLIDSMDEYDSGEMDEYSSEHMMPEEGMATIVEEESVPLEDVGEVLAGKINKLGAEQKEEYDESMEDDENMDYGDEDTDMSELPSFLRDAWEQKRKRSRGK